MEAMYPVLTECALFSGIRREELSSLLVCLGARVMPIKKGQLLFREGDPAASVGIVLSGAVQLIREDYYGNRSLVGHVGTGELFVEPYAFSQAKTLPVSVLADADGSVMLLDSRRMSGCCKNACDFHNRLIANLLQLIAEKNLMLHQKLQITSRRTTREKLLAYLFSQAGLHNSNTFTIPYDRQELADYLEVDRSGLSAEISKLRREGILESEKSTFRLL